jgi:hypothetical protein
MAVAKKKKIALPLYPSQQCRIYGPPVVSFSALPATFLLGNFGMCGGGGAGGGGVTGGLNERKGKEQQKEVSATPLPYWAHGSRGSWMQ